jgi:hypothetical protein
MNEGFILSPRPSDQASPFQNSPPSPANPLRELDQKIDQLAQKYAALVDRLIAKPGNVIKMRAWKLRLAHLQQEQQDEINDFKALNLAIGQCEENDKKLFFIGGLAQQFYRWCQQCFTQEFEHAQTTLLEKQRACQISLDAITTQLPSEHEEQIETIFKIECEWREAYQHQIPSDEIYKKKILPLYLETKKRLINHPRKLAIQSSAAIGKAAHAYFAALKLLAQEPVTLIANGNSASPVYQLPEYQIVLKKPDGRKQEEANCIQSLFQLMGLPEAVVPMFQLREARFDQFHTPYSIQNCARGYKINALADPLKKAIEDKLSPQDKKWLDQAQIHL